MSTTTEENQKSFVVAWLYAMFLGNFGVDRFYLGSPGLGIAKFLTFGGFGVWALLDLVTILSGGAKDARGQKLFGQEAHLVTAWIITSVTLFLTLFLALFFSSTLVGILTGSNL